MGVNTPWCPRCGGWRGFFKLLCAGCMKIDESLAPDGPVTTEEEEAERRKKLAVLVQQRFTKVSERRTDRETYTQALEEMVERNIDVLKEVCYGWMRMRPESRRTRVKSMYVIEMVSVAEAALNEVASLSLELMKYTENKERHEEIMQRVTAGLQAVGRFTNPPEEDTPEPEMVVQDQQDGTLPPGV